MGWDHRTAQTDESLPPKRKFRSFFRLNDTKCWNGKKAKGSGLALLQALEEIQLQTNYIPTLKQHNATIRKESKLHKQFWMQKACLQARPHQTAINHQARFLSG